MEFVGSSTWNMIIGFGKRKSKKFRKDQGEWNMIIGFGKRSSEKIWAHVIIRLSFRYQNAMSSSSQHIENNENFKNL
jgi:hypothetical protein